MDHRRLEPWIRPRYTLTRIFFFRAVKQSNVCVGAWQDGWRQGRERLDQPRRLAENFIKIGICIGHSQSWLSYARSKDGIKISRYLHRTHMYRHSPHRRMADVLSSWVTHWKSRIGIWPGFDTKGFFRDTIIHSIRYRDAICGQCYINVRTYRICDITMCMYRIPDYLTK